MLTVVDSHIRIDGHLVVETALAVLNEGQAALDALAPNAPAVFDMADLEQVDSAALSVVFAWMRHANAAQRAFSLKNPPQQLLSLAAVYGVSDVLPLAA